MFKRKNDSSESKKLKKTDKQKQNVLKLLGKQKKERAKRQRKEAPPASSQKSLAYRRMLEDGFCEVSEGLYSKTFRFSDINYQIIEQNEQENVFGKYCEMLNSCDSETSLQLNIINRKKDKQEFQKEMSYELQGDDLDVYRQEMNNMLLEKVSKGNSSLIKEKYLTFTQKGKDLEQVKPSLYRLQNELMGHFEGIGCETKELDGLERLEVANQTLRPEQNLHFEYSDLLLSRLTTHSAIAPTSFDFKYKKHRFKIADNFAQVLYLRTYPTELSDKLISEITDIPASLDISIHIQPLEQRKALDLVKRKLTFMEQQKVDEQKRALKSGYDPDMIPMELRYSMVEAEDLLDQMQNDNEKLFDFTFLVFVQHPEEEVLDELVEQIFSVGRRNNCEFAKLDYLQEEGLNSILMWGENYVPIERTLTTASAGVFIPFTAQELTQAGGKYYGLNSITRNIVSFDRRQLKNGNGLIFGAPGYGKSFASKKEMVSVLLKDEDAEVIIIDPEREYTPMADGLNGEVIHISAGSENHINPMEINSNYADDEDPITLKADFILSLCDLLIGGTQRLSPTQKSLIDRACRLVYQKYFNGQSEMPTLKDFHNALKSQPEQESKQIAVDLELYIEGSLSVFSHQTNVDTQARFVVFDVKDLGKQLRTMGMLIVLDQIWNRITQNRNRGRRTWLYIDEMQLLVSNDYAENYFFELWSRARKWGVIPTGITQNVATLLLSANVERMLSNSDFILMLNQAKNDRQRLTELLHLSPQQQRYITNADAGAGLLFAGNAIIPFYDEFPRDTSLYRMMSTKIEDIYKFQKEDHQLVK
ncbi:VirB4-like conjugal transfer ATPase, CD1110 family [Enterococcus casseliflavus]|uniref:VirB4-like conjugal transfer ATPase, CD1110 family n=1 Tax=Enterococcus casseliflavus TaxID=37734 RepID=UPI0035DB8EAA